MAETRGASGFPVAVSLETQAEQTKHVSGDNPGIRVWSEQALQAQCVRVEAISSTLLPGGSGVAYNADGTIIDYYGDIYGVACTPTGTDSDANGYYVKLCYSCQGLGATTTRYKIAGPGSGPGPEDGGFGGGTDYNQMGKITFASATANPSANTVYAQLYLVGDELRHMDTAGNVTALTTTGAQLAADSLPLSGTRTMTGDMDMGGKTIKSAVGFQVQTVTAGAAPASSTAHASIYSIGGNIYFKDTAGNAIQATSAGGVYSTVHLAKAGGTMAGNIDMGTNNILKVGVFSLVPSATPDTAAYAQLYLSTAGALQVLTTGGATVTVASGI